MRLIDADALMEKINNAVFTADMTTTCAVSMACRWLDSAPTIYIEERLNDAYAHGWSDAEAMYHDAVSVVRCKDCKHMYRTIFRFK